MTVRVWHPSGATLVRYGRPDPRPGLQYGDYIPEAPNVSAPGTNGVTAGLLNAGILTDYNSAATTTLTLTDGATFTDKVIYGDLRGPSVQNSNITFTNCWLRGGNHVPTTNDGILNASGTRSGSGRIILTDCEISPQLPALNRDCVRGNRVEIYRSWLHGGIDLAVPYATTAQNGGNAYFYMYGSVLENMRYGYPDYDNGVSGATEHTDGTHNDGIAISGGKNIRIQGNLIRATSTPLPGTTQNPTQPNLFNSGYANGQAILITNTVSNPLDATVIVEENWIQGALHGVFVNPNMTAILQEQPVLPRLLRRHHHPPTRATGSGTSSASGNGVVPDNNTWVDGPYIGQVLTEPRDAGINFIS